jgi:glucose/arabinose dehydrogenase
VTAVLRIPARRSSTMWRPLRLAAPIGLLAACSATAPTALDASVPDVASSAASPSPTDPSIPTSSPATDLPISATAGTSTSLVTTTTTTTTSTTTISTTTAPAPPPPGAALAEFRGVLTLVADLEKPTAVAWRRGDDAMYVATQPGPIYRVGDETTVVLDLTAETAEYLPGSERGVLGLAFHPDDGRMFVNYTDRADDTRVVSYALSDGLADPASVRSVLSIDQPGVGHNGGRLQFDTAGNLYIGSGDGGASNGRDAQDTTKLLGAILRVVPVPDGPGYTIPSDNPFVAGGADRPEVIARGLRNPWGFSIDHATGDVWIGDVGNDTREEVNVMRSGEFGRNFGWYFFEGTNQRRSQVPDGLTPPVHDYPRDVGVAVMGGYVYRGDALAPLRGAYVFGDLTGPIWALGSDGVTRLDLDPVNTMTGWGEDPDGELYVFGLYDGVFRLDAA